MSAGTPLSFETIYEERGEKEIVPGPWQPSSEIYDGLKIMESRTIDVEFQIKNNPFVKKAPTGRTIKIVEKSPEKIVARLISKARQVPYCDCFYVEEEWYIAATPKGTNSCAFRVSYALVFVSSTIMKSVIKSNTDSEEKAFWAAWVQTMKDKNADFVQLDKPAIVEKPAGAAAGEKEAAVDPNADYTKESELKALFG